MLAFFVTIFPFVSFVIFIADTILVENGTQSSY